ncbi:glycosyltransferase [Halomonas sp. KAO]|uniref:glycosyltransferase n=1 Tax=Halomonas sp. KAO TaxID=2783858 RepID=UPI00189E6657|nr:glycosyltransferase [Halomonas sp. KAO]MBF7052329.1 glycosyltransferase [Halomonas sp. KAO]
MLSALLQQRLVALGWFDAEWYSRQYPDVAASGLVPWEHFIRYGAQLGRRPGPRFDPQGYLAANPDLRGAAVVALIHYLQHGQAEGRSLEPVAPRREDEGKAEEQLESERAWLAASELFDDEWYLAEYPDIARVGLDPRRHYLLHGAAEGRDPGPWFDTRHYLSQLPLEQAPLPEGKAPLLHYLTVGKASGLKPWTQPSKLPSWYQHGAPSDDGVLRALYVLSVRTGGTPQTNEDLMHALQGEAECLVLRCRGPVMLLMLYCEGRYLPLTRHVLAEVPEPLPHRSAEYDRVVAVWLKHYRVSLVHIRHIAWHGLGLLEVAKRIGIPTVFSFHDYYALCPSVKLLDEQQRFCGGRCTTSAGECSQELWSADQVPPLKHRAIHEWQRVFADVLPLADALITTSLRAREIITGIYPQLDDARFRVIPHGRDFGRMHELAEPPVPEEPLRVVLPGFISLAKGGALLQGLATRARALNLELHVVGSVDRVFAMPAGVIVHGRYQRERLPELLATIRPHVGAVLSIWPETHCHTLTELWACGIPVVGIDLGAVGERLAESGAGWRVAERTLLAVCQTLEQAADPEEWHAAHAAVKRWQVGVGQQETCAWMAERYLAVYREVCQAGSKTVGAP